MRIRIPELVVGGIALVFAGCAEGSFTNRVTLPLTLVNSEPLPATLPSGTGTVQVLSGSLVGSRLLGECTWTLNFSGGSNPAGTLSNCSLDPGLSRSVEVDLGGPPLPSGTHSYHFGVQ